MTESSSKSFLIIYPDFQSNQSNFPARSITTMKSARVLTFKSSAKMPCKNNDQSKVKIFQLENFIAKNHLMCEFQEIFRTVFYLARISNALINFYYFAEISILDLLVTLSPFARRDIKGKICVSGFVSLFRAVFDIDFPEKALFEPNDLLYIYYNKHSHRTETKKGNSLYTRDSIFSPVLMNNRDFV